MILEHSNALFVGNITNNVIDAIDYFFQNEERM